MLFAARSAFALTEGNAPAVFNDAKGVGGKSHFIVRGSAIPIGNTLLEIGADQYVNSQLLTPDQAKATLTLPNDFTVVSAYAFWSASAFAQPLQQPVPSQTVQFYTPAGLGLSGGASITANNCQSFSSFTSSPNGGDVGPSYYCRADVTDLVKAHPPAVLSSNGQSLQGDYSVGGLTNLRPGIPSGGGIGSCGGNDLYSCQAAFAGWSLIVVYSSPTAPSTRDVVIYDGFLRMDEQFDFQSGTGTSGILAPQTLSNFLVGPSHQGEFSFFGMEGDPQLGFDGVDGSGRSVPEIVNNSDFMQLGGTDVSGGVPWPPSTANMLQDANNPWGNLFNSTGVGNPLHRGVDLDRFNVSSLLTPGQTSIALQPGSGDGIPNPGYSLDTQKPCAAIESTGPCAFGDGQTTGIVLSNGEYFLVGWSMLALDTVAPDFSQSSKTPDVTTAAPGDTITFTIKVRDTGKATSTTVQDNLPASVTYLPGSTTAKAPGVPITINIPDSGGQSALANGGFTIPFQIGVGSPVREVDFTLKAKVNDNTFGQQICNTANIISPDISVPVALTTNPCTRVVSPSLDTPILLVRVNGQASTTAPHRAQPGDALTYVATLNNSGDATARNVSFHLDLPPFSKSFSLAAQGDAGATFTQSPGGANNTGQFDLTNVTIAAHSPITVVWQVNVFSEADFAGAGFSANAIDGKAMPEQGVQRLSSLPAQPSDDPATSATPDPTTVTLRYLADLSTSTKSAAGGSGGVVVPGDLVTYTIDLRNPGNRSANVSLADDLPPGVSGCVVVQPAGATCSASGGANGTGQLGASGIAVGPGADVQVIFRVNVRGDAANGLVITNTAVASAFELAAPQKIVSNPLTVRAVVDLSGSTKTVRDVTSGTNTFVPGDTVEYTVVLRNTGSQAGTSVTLDDAIPANLTFLAGSAQPAATFDGAALHWTTADLAPGAQAAFLFRATLASAVPVGTTVSNTAHGASAQATVDARASFVVTSSPTFTASSKTVVDVAGRPATAVHPGDQLLYTLVIKNTGNAPATNVQVADTLDGNLAFVSSAQPSTFAAPTVRWTLPVALQPGDSASLQFVAQLAPAIANGTRIDNFALVSATEATAPQQTQTASVTVASSGSLAASTKTAQVEAPGTPLPGRKVTYTLTVQDAGNSPADDVVVLDPLPSCLVSPVPGNGGVVSAGTVRWDKTTTPALAHVLPGAPVTLTLVATIAPNAADGSSCDNVGHLTSSDVGPADVTAHLVVVSKPELSKSIKSVKLKVDVNGDGLFSPGDRIEYAVTVSNSGTATASAVNLSDALPTQLVNVVAIPASSGGSPATWQLGALAPGASTTVIVDADVAVGTPNATPVCNTGQLSTPELSGAAPTQAPGGGATCFTVDSHPDLSRFLKTVAGSRTRKPGDTLVYTLSLPNSGTAAATQVKLTDALDAHLGLVSAQVSDGGAATFDPVARTVSVAWPGPLAPGATFTVALSAKLLSSIDNGTQVPNQAHAREAAGKDFPSDDPATSAPLDPTVVTVVSAADLTAATKTVTPVVARSIHPGDRVHYLITVPNTGTADARNLVISDPVDARLAVVTPIPGGGVLVNGAITWTVALLRPSDPPAVFTFDAVVKSPLPNGTVIANQGSIAAQGLAQPQLTNDPVKPGINNPTTFTVTSAPDLSTSTKAFVDQTRTDGTVHPGDTLAFTLQPRNTGDAETTSTVVSDQLDPGLVFVSAGQGGSYAAATRTVSWTLPRIGLDPLPPLTLVATVVKPLPNGTVIKNTGRFAAAELPSGAATNTVTLTVTAMPDLSGLTKILLAPPALVTPGTVLTYAIRVVNAGDGVATNVSVLDPIDPGLDQISPLDGGVLGGATIAWSLPSLAPSAVAVVRFSARVKLLTANGTVIANQAQVTAAEAPSPQLSDDPATPAPHDPTRVTVTSAPDLSTTTKVVAVLAQPTPGLLRPLDTLRYTIAVQNTGNTYARRVIVRDPLDPLLTAAAPEEGGRVQGGSLVWDAVPALAKLAPGAAVLLHFNATVSASARDGEVIANQAQLTSDEGLPFASDDPSTPAPHDPTRIAVRFADVRVLKTWAAVQPRADGTVHPGDLVDWTITLANRGSFAASHAAVDDPLDASLVDILPAAGGVLAPGRVIWTEAATPGLAQLAPGATLSLGFRSRIKPLTRNGVHVANQASVRAVELNAPVLSDDPSTAAPNDPTVLTVTSLPDLRVTTKTVRNLTRADGTFRPGDQVAYAITVRNSGDEAATNVIVKDAIDAGLATPVLQTPGTPLPGPIIQWDATTVPALATVSPGDAVVLAFTATVGSRDRDGQLVVNQARLFATELLAPTPSDDPSTPAPGDPTVFTVLAGPRLGHSIKTVTNLTEPGGLVRPGDVLDYELHVLNDGSDPSINTVLTDAPPPQTRYQPGSTKLNGVAVPDLPGGQSALEHGVTVTSPRAGTQVGSILPSTGAVPDDTAALVSFHVRVEDGALAGTVISNQGQLRADQIAQAATDDPSTPAPGDPTVVVVGAAPALQILKTWRLAIDQKTPGIVDPGDTIEYSIDVENRGTTPAQGLLLDDPLPAGATFVAGSLTLGGRAQPDPQQAGRLHLTLGTLAPGARALVVFRMLVQGPGPLVNQAQLTGAGGLAQLSDGDPTLPGDQPTVTPVGAGGVDLSTSAKSVVDENGGDVLPGDELLYTITLVNTGNADTTQAVIEDQIPLGVDYVQGSAAGDGTVTYFPGTNDPGSVRSSGITVLHGGRAQIHFRVRVAATVGTGSVLRNVAGVRLAPNAPRTDLPAAIVVVGQAQGAVGIFGHIWQDLDGDNVLTSADRLLTGYQLLLRRSDSPAILRSVAVDASGLYRLPDLPPASYVAEAVSPEGTHFGELVLPLNGAGGTQQAQDLQIQPGGELYRSDTKGPVPGTQLFLLYDDSEVGNAPPACEHDQSPIGAGPQPLLSGRTLPRPVDAQCLRSGQQGQRTGALGLYRFDLAAPAAGLPPGTTGQRRYRLEAETGTPVLRYPGTKPLPDPALAPAGRVVPEGDPESARAPHWFQRFTLAPGELVLNNHLALDPSGLRLTKVAGRTSASVGDLVAYTVTVQNPTHTDLLVDASGSGGVHLADSLPDALRYAHGSARAVRLVGADRRCARVAEEAQGAGCPSGAQGPAASEQGKYGKPVVGRFLDLGPYDLRAGETLEVRYSALVGTSAQSGDAVNRAIARAGNVDVSNADSATVRIAQDPLFDLASLIGGVYCGPELPGARAEKQGVPGVRIYQDEGYYAESDASGKFHFKALQPGLHRFKIDARTLPPGSEVQDGGALTINLTRGLDARANFGVACKSVEVGPTRLALKAPPPAPPPPLPPLSIAGDVRALSLAVDGAPLLVPAGDALHEGSLAEVADGKLWAPLRYRTLLATGPVPLAWRLVARDGKLAEVAVTEGKGAPPETIELAPRGPLQAGAVWQVQLVLASGQGSRAGPLRALRFVERQPEPKLLQEWQLRGVFFEEGSAVPTRELVRQLGPAAAKLADAALRAQVEVHVAGEAPPEGLQALSDDRARAVRDALATLGVQRDRIEARGRGGEDPLQVPITERGKQQNRRVVIRAIKPPPPPEPAPEPLVAQRAVSSGKPLRLDARGSFSLALEPGSATDLELVRADGASILSHLPAFPTAIASQLRVDPARAQAQAGEVAYALPLLALGVQISGDGSIDPGGHPRELAFSLGAAVADAVSWSLAVGSDSAPEWEASGAGIPPQRVAFPEDRTLAPGRHFAQLTVKDAQGGEGHSGRAHFQLVALGKPLFREILPTGSLFAGRAVSRDGIAKLKSLLPKLTAAEAGRVAIEVFSDDAEGALRFSQERAAAIAKVLADLGLKSTVSATGRGPAQPVAPNATAVGRRKNNRVVLSTYPAQKGAAPPAEAQPVFVRVDGKAAQSQAEAFVIELSPGKARVSIEAQRADGAGAKTSLALPAAARATLSPAARAPASAGGGGATSVATATAPTSPGPASSGPAASEEAAPLLALPPLPSLGQPAAAAAAPPSVGAQPAASPPALDPGPPPLAASLLVTLPPPGAVVRAEALWLRGTADPRNKVAVNGHAIVLDSAGRFELRLPLQRGEQKLQVSSTDPEGNIAYVERTFTVDPDGLFVLLLGEGDFGQSGAQLAGLGDRADLGPVFLKGRASGVVEGRWDTSARLGGLFKDVQLSGQFDSSRRNDPTFFRELVDPARFYPIDGDSGAFVQEAATRGPLFLKLRADQSQLVVGDYQTRLTSTNEQLFRYDRTLYGLDLDLNQKGLAGGAVDSRVTGFAAQGDLRTRHSHAELHGTGGSLYWLRNPDLVEGSERVVLVVRDAVTGLELLRTEKVRDVDYTLRAQEGRIDFKQPIPSTADASFLINTNYTNPLGGNPVFILVDYEYRGTADDGRGAVGVHAEETLFGLVNAGGGLVHENHPAGEGYTLAGLHLGVRPRPRTFVNLELAQSSGSDAESYASNDGGLTFGTLGANCLDRTADLYACLQSGRALRLEGGAELADFFGPKNGPELLRGAGYFEARERGFAADGNVAEQGTKKGGLLLSWVPGAQTRLVGRFDSVASDLALAFDPVQGYQTKRVLRRQTGLQLQHVLGAAGTEGARWTLTAEASEVYTNDPQLGSIFTDQLLGGAAYRANDKLTFSLQQQAAVRADDRQYTSTGDRFATTLGATLKLSDQLYAQLAETVQWSGQNATQLGLRTPLFGSGSLYANERMSLRGGQLLATSIVGAEERIGGTARSYGEYQLDNQADGASQRAVLGLSNRFQLLPGLFATLAYERAQVLGRGTALGGGLGLSGSGVPGAVPGATLGAINGVSPGASPALNPGATCIPGTTAPLGSPPQQGSLGSCSPSFASGYNPAGGYFPGTSARDALSGSLEMTFDARIKASAKAELRKDTADQRLVGVTPGVADRLQLVFFGDATMKWTDDLGLFARLHWADSLVGAQAGAGPGTRVEAQFLEATLGLSLRPVRWDTINMLFKLTHLLDQRPLDLTSGLVDEQLSDVISLSPTLELPWHLALAEKLAWKHTRARSADGPELTTDLLLWINRLDLHVHPKLDLSGEFRWMALHGPTVPGDAGASGDGERGLLFEAAFRPSRYARVGVGWNFTSFSDDELARYDHSSGGLFVRAVGEY